MTIKNMNTRMLKEIIASIICYERCGRKWKANKGYAAISVATSQCMRTSIANRAI